MNSEIKQQQYTSTQNGILCSAVSIDTSYGCEAKEAKIDLNNHCC